MEEIYGMGNNRLPDPIKLIVPTVWLQAMGIKTLLADLWQVGFIDELHRQMQEGSGTPQ